MADAIETSVVHGREAVLAALEQVSGVLAEYPVSARELWLSCWVEAFRDSVPVAVTLVRGGSAVGFACLGLRRRGPLTEVTLAGHGPSDYGRLAAPDEAVRQQLAADLADLVRSLRGPWRLRLDQLPVDDPVVRRLARTLPYSAVEPAEPLPMLRIREPRTLEEHTHRHLRQAVRKARRRVEGEGRRLEFETVTDRAALLALRPQLGELARRRDHALGRRSSFDSRQWREFHRLVLDRMALTGDVVAMTARLDGELAIYMLVLRDGEAWRLWDTRMNPEYAWSSPGYLMYGHLVELALADPAVRQLDWQRGLSPHKLRASTEIRQAELFTAYSGPVVRACYRTSALVRGYARDALSPKVKRALRGDVGPVVAALALRLRGLRNVGRCRSAHAERGEASERNR